MKKYSFLTLLALSYLTVATAQQVIEVKTERKVPPFHTIRIATGISAKLTKSDKETVIVSSSSNIYQTRIFTEVKDSILYIYYSEPKGASSIFKGKQPAKNLKAYISYTFLKRIIAESGASIEQGELLKNSELTITANTGSIIRLNLEVNNIVIESGEGAMVILKGSCKKLRITAETGSEFLGSDFLTDECSADASTGAIITTKTVKKLKAVANTGGIIKYKAGVAELIKTVATDGIVDSFH